MDQLITYAKQRMASSRDPIHEITHAERVVTHIKRLSRELHIPAATEEALILAAWWHDVGRTITRKPSLIWMPFVDDLISAVMLWWHTIIHGRVSHTTNLAVRLIACKSFGTGTLLMKIFFTRKNRFLVDIIEDADNLDILTVERASKILELTEDSRLYHAGYRMMCWWFSTGRMLEMRTEVAQKYLIEILEQFLVWINDPQIFWWHVEQYGAIWADKHVASFQAMLEQLRSYTAASLA